MASLSTAYREKFSDNQVVCIVLFEYLEKEILDAHGGILFSGVHNRRTQSNGRKLNKLNKM